MTKRKRYDWEVIRQQYVTGTDEVTLDELAAEHGPAPETVRRQAAKGKWTEARSRHRHKIATKVEEKAVDIAAKRRSGMLKVADAMKAVGGEALRRLGEDLRADQTLRLTSQEIRLLLKDGTDIERVALGMPDLVAMDDNELDRKILALVSELESDAESGGS